MKRLNKKGKFKSIIQSIIIISTVFVSSLPVLAYKEPVKVCESTDSANYDCAELSAYIKLGRFEETEYKLPDFNKTESVTYYFIDEDNNIHKIDEHNEKAACNHTYKYGSYMKHMLNRKGGCTAEYYNAKQCTKCGTVILGTKYKTVTYEKCPH